jgi:hypothetical protein
MTLEHLQDIFYTSLLEDLTLVSFKSGWLGVLGDLAWYQMRGSWNG